MTRCASCGQEMPPSDRPMVRVDEDLLQLCNRAWEEAAQRASPRVEIAHVAWCLATGAATGSRRWLARLDGRGFELAILADRRLSGLEGALGEGAPRTCPQLKALLGRAQLVAQLDARAFAGPEDFLAALLDRADDLSTAAFAGGLRPVGPPRAQHEHQHVTAGAAHPPQTSDSDGLRPGTARPALSRSFDRGCIALGRERQLRFDFEGRRRAEAGDPRAVSERLARQEQEIAELRAMVARLLAGARTSARPGEDREHGTDARSDQVAAGRATSEPDDANVETAGLQTGQAEAIGAVDDLAVRPPGRRSRSLRRVRMLRASSGRALRHPPGTGEPPATRSEPSGPATAPFEVEAGKAPARTRAVSVAGFAGGEVLAELADTDSEDDTEGSGDRMKRFYLSPDDDIVNAPSIGPRTAARLIPAGLVLVRDLLACDPVDVARRTATRYITADRIAEWKAQARLVCTIPWLRGMHAQLLVGAGYDTLAKLVRADPSNVCAAVLRFAATREGQSILRTAPAPEIDRIACWIENTALAEPSRAA